MHTFEVKNGTYKIEEIKNDHTLIALNLNQDIVFSFYAPKIGLSGIAFNISATMIDELFSNLITTPLLTDFTIKISIVGGTNSDQSKIYIDTLIEKLNALDNNRHIIDIISFDVLKKIHPKSIKYSSYSNLIYPL